VSETWLRLDSGPGDAAFNMALDEALLDSALRLGQPLLRFYGWAQSAASFGYFQRIAELEQATLLRPLVRRPTGGGLVPHDADWTYSVVVPAGHDWYGLKAQESYRRMHEWIQSAFARLDVETRLAECCHRARPGECFAGYEKDDVLWQGRKVAGAAQRRTKSGLLIQGSIQPPPLALSRVRWQDALCAVQPVAWDNWLPDADTLAHAKELLRIKHGRAAYQRKR
jgi:lipoate-protein ligase A